MSIPVNLHELASLPFGEAVQVLKKTGHWNEEAAAENGKLTEYTVEVSGTYLPTVETEKVVVLATSLKEAKIKAEDRTDFDEIEGVEIVSVREVDQ